MSATLLCGDVREVLVGLPDASVRCVVTSPPYFGLRDYGQPGQIGREQTTAGYVGALVEVFQGVRRVLRDDGTLWLNLGDSYAANRSYQVPSTKGGAKHSPAQGFEGSAMRVPDGMKPKDLMGIPWAVAFALRADGWYLRSEIIWHKPNVMPESVKDRPTRAHEQIFLLTKSERYHYDAEAIAEPASANKPWSASSNGGAKAALVRNDGGNSATLGKPANGTRNARSVWAIVTRPYKGAHFATFPPALAERCILAGSQPGDMILDPFGGSGTTAAVAVANGRRAIYIDLNPDYLALAETRIAGVQPTLEVA